MLVHIRHHQGDIPHSQSFQTQPVYRLHAKRLSIAVLSASQTGSLGDALGRLRTTRKMSVMEEGKIINWLCPGVPIASAQHLVELRRVCYLIRVCGRPQVAIRPHLQSDTQIAAWQGAPLLNHLLVGIEVTCNCYSFLSYRTSWSSSIQQTGGR